MYLKRFCAIILLVVMMGSLLLLQNSSLANDDSTDSPSQTESGFDNGDLDLMAEGTEQTDTATLTQEEPAAGDPDVSTETDAPADETSPLTDTDPSSSETSDNTDLTEATDEPAPVVFLAGAAYQIEVNGTEAAGGAQLTAQLEAQNPDATWSAVEDPNQPNEAYTILLVLDANGAAGGQFSLEGFSNTCA